MNDERPCDLSVCICTFKRPELLKRCLGQILIQTIACPFEVVVVDNDLLQSGRSTVDGMLSLFSHAGRHLRYATEPRQNISLARNRAIQTARGSWVAFIDDDEYPTSTWLQQLLETAKAQGVDGVLGPVLPEFPAGFPKLIQNSGLFTRRRMPTGSPIREGLKSGNMLVTRAALTSREGPFREDLGLTGGEDTEFLQWLQKTGSSLCWCDEAMVHEVQCWERRRLIWHLRRGYRGGWIHAKRICERWSTTKALCWILLRSAPSIGRGILRSVCQAHGPVGACLLLLRELAKQAGKIGYFLGVGARGYGEP